jgi:hypothetical protein
MNYTEFVRRAVYRTLVSSSGSSSTQQLLTEDNCQTTSRMQNYVLSNGHYKKIYQKDPNTSVLPWKKKSDVGASHRLPKAVSKQQLDKQDYHGNQQS